MEAITGHKAPRLTRATVSYLSRGRSRKVHVLMVVGGEAKYCRALRLSERCLKRGESQPEGR